MHPKHFYSFDPLTKFKNGNRWENLLFFYKFVPIKLPSYGKTHRLQTAH